MSRLQAGIDTIDQDRMHSTFPVELLTEQLLLAARPSEHTFVQLMIAIGPQSACLLPAVGQPLPRTVNRSALQMIKADGLLPAVCRT